MKETREILDNILRMKKSEYEMLEPSTTSFASKQFGQKGLNETNVLSGKADTATRKDDSMADMESYESTQKMDFKVDEIKDCLEKKKKRRNYLEFRPDYEKS